MAVQLVLYRSCSETPKTGFLRTLLIFPQDFGGRSIDSSDAKEMIKSYLNDVGREISDRVYFTEEEVGDQILYSKSLRHPKYCYIYPYI